MSYTLVDVINVEVLEGYKLRLQFDDGVQGDVDISQLIPFEGIFQPLNDRSYFSKVAINPDIGTICWDNGADISPAFLRSHIQAHG